MSNQNCKSDENGEPLISTMAADADMLELIEFFIEELDSHVASIREALVADDKKRLQHIMHQLKGAAGGYGFQAITDAAAEVEAQTLCDEVDISSLTEKVEEFIRLCKRAVATN